MCLYSNNFKFDQDHLLQTNDTATSGQNSCSYSEITIYSLDKLRKNEQIMKNDIYKLFFMGGIKTIV